MYLMHIRIYQSQFPPKEPGTGFGLKNSGREVRELTELKGISPLKGSFKNKHELNDDSYDLNDME